MKILLSEQGFTLIEVMVAIAILSVGILTLNIMQITAINGNSTANKLSGATIAATDRIERIFCMDYDDLVDNENADGVTGAADGEAGLVPENNDTDATADAKADDAPAGYQIYWNVAEGVPMPLTKTVSIIVKRSERGMTKRVVYNYIKAAVVKK